MQLLDAAELHRRLSMSAAIDALEAGFRAQDPSATPLRSHVATPAGSLLLMPAFGDGGVGVKLVTLTPDNPERALPYIGGVYVLFDAVTQTPEAIVDGAALTALRTAAVSGVATRHLANPDAERLVIFGAGVQARSHLEAMVAARPIRHVTVVSRTLERARALVAEARDRADSTHDVGDVGDVADADVVCTCTTSDEPLFDGGRLAAGAHVNAVGSYQPASRELDTTAMLRARVVVETREAALAEAGELAIPIGQGTFGTEHVVADLAEVVHGAVVRTRTVGRHAVQVGRAGVRGPDRGPRCGGRGMSSTADVVVVGGGVVGASAAYHLAAAGVEHVVLLERADALATGSTGACAGGFRHQFSSRINIELSLASVPMILGFTQEHGLPLDVVQDGYLFLVRNEHDWDELPRRGGAPAIARRSTRSCSRRTRQPTSLRGSRSTTSSAATFCSDDGIADPSGLTQGYATLARRAGAELRLGVEVGRDRDPRRRRERGPHRRRIDRHAGGRERRRSVGGNARRLGGGHAAAGSRSRGSS